MAKYSSESSKSSLPSIEQIFLAADSSTLNRVVPINKSYNPASTQFKSNNPIEGWYKGFNYFLNFLNFTCISLLYCAVLLDYTASQQKDNLALSSSLIESRTLTVARRKFYLYYSSFTYVTVFFYF